MAKSRTVKICVVVLILALMGSGGVFAADEGRRPMNTLTVDLGPLAFGLGVGMGLNAAIGSSSGWGIGAQYEFQPFRYFSLAGKYSYMGMNTSVSAGGVKVGLDFSSYSIEGHLRWYPWGKTFFLDGMGGYANFATKLETSGLSSLGVASDINDKEDIGYFKTGGELGWRVDFGKPGGFVFEMALGYFVGIGPKSNFTGLQAITSQLKELESLRPIAKQFGYDIPDIASNPAGIINGLNDLLSDYIFVGGPKMTLAVGWRF